MAIGPANSQGSNSKTPAETATVSPMSTNPVRTARTASVILPFPFYRNCRRRPPAGHCGIHLLWERRGAGRSKGVLARLDAPEGNDCTPAGSTGPHGRRYAKPARRKGFVFCLRVARTRYSVFTEPTSPARSAVPFHLGAFECSTPT